MPSFSRNINVISRCASTYRADKLDGYGISSAHYFYILAVCRTPGISQDKLAQRLYINKSSVARVLQTLESDGFITRCQNESDRRETLVYPTEKAEKVLPIIREAAKSWEDFLFSGFNDDEREAFMGMLEKLCKKAASYVEEEREGEK